ncbi:TonB-dependent receptor [Shimia thalassica]|uniref:TonB-dependent receptor plug domain-containing protein n=1 Tax=Shimia thalassica TaxID=1715693 RepID=UPI001C08806F|nr:TonB-dependent receptor [Shimia thalassica]MBU2941093.1 TonB-dependent receptor [Shimia thalassica]MDO6503423.1 TonB-dependent receptor [Shimia thalassica]
MKLSFRGALLLSTSFVLAGQAMAEDDSDDFDLGEIRIETDSAQKVLGNVEITDEEIAQRNPTSVQELFIGETSVTASGGAAIAQKVYVNGIEESLLNVTIDGARQNKTAFHHAGNVLIDPSMLKAVEVTSGLAPADAGPGGLGGSLAYTTKDARDLLEPGDTFGGSVSIAGGSNGYGIRSNLTLFGLQGGFEYVLSGTKHDGDDYKDGDGTLVEGTEADITDYMVKVAYTNDAGHRLAFSASETEDTGLRAAQAGPGGLLFTRPDFTGLTTGPNTLIEGLSRRTSYSLTYTNENPTGWFDPFFQLAYNEQEIDAGGVSGVNTSFSGTFKNTFRIANGTIDAGIDFFDESAEGWTDAPFLFTGTETNRNIGIFAQSRQDLSSRTSVSYGARYDWQEFEGADGSEHKDSGLSVNGAVDFALSDTLTLNAGVASTWGGYELGEAALINFFTPWSYAGFTTSSSISGRLGLRYANAGWNASGAIFRTDINDLSAVLPSGGARGATTDISTKGFDATVGYNWAEGFARMNYTYADVTQDGATIGSTSYYYGRPMGQIFALETAWYAGNGFTIGGSAEIALKNDETSTAGTMSTLPGYEVFNLYAEYIPPNMDNLSIRLDIRNLFDETYTTRGADGAGPTSTSRQIPLNEPGRTVSLMATVRF